MARFDNSIVRRTI